MNVLQQLVGFAFCCILPVALGIAWLAWSEHRTFTAKRERSERLARQRKEKRELSKLANPTVKAPQSRGAGSGTLDDYKITSNKGSYVMTKAPQHPLSGKNGWLALHRAVLFDYLGPGEHLCYWCKRKIEWHKPAGGPYLLPAIHVDHLDDNPRNNRLWNLAASCERCNRGRSKGRYGAQSQLTAIHSRERRMREAFHRSRSRRYR